MVGPTIQGGNRIRPAIYTESNKLYFYSGVIDNENPTMYNIIPIIRYGYKTYIYTYITNNIYYGDRTVYRECLVKETDAL